MREFIAIVEGRKLVQHVVTPDMIDGPLYHGTGHLALADILHTDRLKGSKDRVGVRGVSTTTRLWWAENVARNADRVYQWASKESLDHWHRTGFGDYEGPVIVLNGKLLVSELETKAVKWRLESPLEERVLGDIFPLSRYLDHILVHRPSVQRILDSLEKKAEVSGSHASVWRKRRDDFKAVMTSPILRDRI